MRQKFEPRLIRLVGHEQVQRAIALIGNVPVDPASPIEVVIREEKKVRKPSANDRMWAGPLADIARQAWLHGRQFSAEVWHEHFKREFLPEADDADLDRLVRDPETWRKWDVDPAGNRICVGTTTQLTPYGFSQYLLQVEAFGAELGVMFSEAPGRRAA